MGLLRNVVASMIGTRIATDTKSAGLIGVVAGLAATRVMTRSPIGALVVGGGYIAHKIWQKKYQIDTVGPHKAALENGLIEAGKPTLALPAPKAARKTSADNANKAIAQAGDNPVLTKGP